MMAGRLVRAFAYHVRSWGKSAKTVVVQKRPATTAASATVASTPKTRLRKDKGKASTNAPLPRIDLRAAASTDADRFPAYDLGGACMGTIFAQPAAGSQPSL